MKVTRIENGKSEKIELDWKEGEEHEDFLSRHGFNRYGDWIVGDEFGGMELYTAVKETKYLLDVSIKGEIYSYLFINEMDLLDFVNRFHQNPLFKVNKFVYIANTYVNRDHILYYETSGTKEDQCIRVTLINGDTLTERTASTEITLLDLRKI